MLKSEPEYPLAPAVALTLDGATLVTPRPGRRIQSPGALEHRAGREALTC